MNKYLWILVCTICFTTPATAHHNWRAIYDVDADIEFEGVISAIEWKNPHVRISFTVDAGADTEAVYTTESNSVASLERMDVTEELLAIGTPVRVAGYRSRLSDNDLYVSHLLLPGIREVVFLHNIEPRWPEAVRVGSANRLLGGVVEENFSKRPTSIFGVWTTIYDNPGSHHALGREQAEWVENTRPRSGGPAAAAGPAAVDSSCTPKGMPLIMGIPYPIELIDQDEVILIHAEESDSIREVHMNLPHDDPGTTDILGYSTGRWVGETLSVITTFGGTDSNMQIHETFHLSDDHNRLQYTQIIIDPERRQSPTMNKKWWQYTPGTSILPYDCDY